MEQGILSEILAAIGEEPGAIMAELSFEACKLLLSTLQIYIHFQLLNRETSPLILPNNF